MFKQCAILFGCLAIGEAIVFFTGIPIPSSILGMLLLTALLYFRVIKLEWIKPLADFLIANLGFFFVPPGIALMCYLDIIKAQFLPIVATAVISTVVVFMFTGWAHQLTDFVQSKLVKRFKSRGK